uniref:Putative secreted protein n=1 Tax=Anopheles darlingi TaxID=43151 RepID=A0A2M4DQ25_ANODA
MVTLSGPLVLPVGAAGVATPLISLTAKESRDTSSSAGFGAGSRFDTSCSRLAMFWTTRLIDAILGGSIVPAIR